ncbi:MAG: hypothetical protein BWY29_00854 [Microgenomates group bacterium ADurb.Bin238]|nr:MAG: hypothetical protein BWY29_00854 [Microgenomates group bacterium ADurb.Bin238]
MVNRVLFMAVVLVLALGGSAVQSQDEIDLGQPGNVKITYADGSQIWCTTDVLDNGWSGGMFIPPPDSPMSTVWASCNVPYSLDGIVSITFSPVSDLDMIVRITCVESFVPEDPEIHCRPS